MKQIIILTIILIIIHNTFSQNNKKDFSVGCVAFYNLENLFDTIDTPDVNDFEFTPAGPNQWTGKRYTEKLSNMAYAISQIGSDLLPFPPAIIGVSEIENKTVLEDLVKTSPLTQYNYQVVHYDGPDRRGIDVGLLYMPSLFKIAHTCSYRLNHPQDTSFKSRDQLLVSGIFDGEPLHIIVNHWPSRRGGEKASRPLRNMAAGLTRHIVDSLLTADNQAKIIVMGDLNDDPINESVSKVLNAKGKIEQLTPASMFNPYYELYQKGQGSLAYQDKWNNFDQIILSSSLIGDDKSNYKFYQAKIVNKPFLINTEGRYKGYPHRTFAGGAYAGGYSDHFPVYILLIKQKH